MLLRHFVLLCHVVALITATTQAAPAKNAVLSWNDQVLNATRLSRNPPPVAALHMATYHVAIFDAVNGITRTHQPWLVNETAPSGANLDAAVAGAASTVLTALWGQASNPRNFQTALETALATIPEGTAKADGLAWGRKVAARVLEERARSGWNKPAEGSFTSNEPGKWRETPPGFRPPVTPQVATTTPFAMKSPDQFRAPPPRALTRRNTPRRSRLWPKSDPATAPSVPSTRRYPPRFGPTILALPPRRVIGMSSPRISPSASSSMSPHAPASSPCSTSPVPTLAFPAGTPSTSIAPGDRRPPSGSLIRR